MHDPTLLYLSNEPEGVTAEGRLFTGTLPAGDSVCRVWYGHQNASSYRMRLVVMIASAAPAARIVTLIGAAAGPHESAAGVARAATERFVRARTVVAASRHVIPPHGEYVLCDVVLGPSQAASGVFDVHAEDGSGLECRTFLCDPAHHQLRIHAQLEDLQFPANERRGIFDIAGSAQPQNVALEGGAAFVELGTRAFARAPHNAYRGAPLQGELGTLRRIQATPPTPLEAQDPPATLVVATGPAATILMPSAPLPPTTLRLHD